MDAYLNVEIIRQKGEIILIKVRIGVVGGHGKDSDWGTHMILAVFEMACGLGW